MKTNNTIILNREEKQPQKSSSLPILKPNKILQTPITTSSEAFSSKVESFLQINKSNSLNPRHYKQFRTNTPNFSHYQPPTIIINNYGIVKGFAASSFTGMKRGKNEDKVQIVLNMKKPITYTEKWPRSSYFAVFDGEGGTECSKFLKEHLHDFIFKNDYFPVYPKKAMISGFAKADSAFLKTAEEHNDFSASSAIVTFFLGKWCFVAGLGDSLALLSLDDGKTVMQLNDLHTVSNEQELDRIIKAGGSLITSYSIYNGQKQDHGVCKIKPGSINHTRSFGNLHSKSKKLGGNPSVCLSTPEVKYLKYQENFDFMLLISSGLAEQLSPYYIINHIWEDLNHFEGNFEEKLKFSLESLMQSAIFHNCQENLSAVLICFPHIHSKFNY